MDEPLTENSERIQMQTRNEKADMNAASPVDDAKLTNAVVDEDRDKWSTKLDFMFSIIGYCVGIGNVWRFVCFHLQ